MKNKAKELLVILSAAVAGACNSIIGAGGGIILSLSLGMLSDKLFKDRKYLYVNSQAAMIPGCALSCILYAIRGNFPSFPVTTVALPAIIGGILGSLILPRLRFEWLKAAFAIFVIWSGVRMIIV